MTKTVAQSGFQDWIWWLLRRYRLVRVTGRSMLPLLQPGDLLFVDPQAYHKCRPQIDDLVVAWHPHQPKLKIIKRVRALYTDETYYLSSDNLVEGTDSRVFGPVALTQIIGRVKGCAIRVRNC